jgi:chromosome segregation ATPase
MRLPRPWRVLDREQAALDRERDDLDRRQVELAAERERHREAELSALIVRRRESLSEAVNARDEAAAVLDQLRGAEAATRAALDDLGNLIATERLDGREAAERDGQLREQLARIGGEIDDAERGLSLHTEAVTARGRAFADLLPPSERAEVLAATDEAARQRQVDAARRHQELVEWCSRQPGMGAGQVTSQAVLAEARELHDRRLRDAEAAAAASALRRGVVERAVIVRGTDSDAGW